MATNKEVAAAAGGSTVIGQTITINGKLTGDEDLTVRGRVEGELTLTKTLFVEPSGIIKANVTVKNAIVSGVVVGNIRATESVELTKEGRMVGDILAPRVILVEGASFRGRIEMGAAEAGRAAGDRVGRATRSTARPAAPPRPPPPPRVEAKHGPNSRHAVTPILTKLEGKAPPLPPALAAGGKKKVVVRKRER